MTSLDTRRARAELYQVTLHHLHRLSMLTVLPDENTQVLSWQHRQIADALGDLERELTVLGSTRVVALVAELEASLRGGGPYDTTQVIAVARLMADEVDERDSSEISVSDRSPSDSSARRYRRGATT